MKTVGKTLVAVVRSRAFFAATAALFLLEAGWIAVSARYPMAFDEDYHLGVIKLYAHQISPLFLHQPAGPAVYGAVARDPSYLYHWLMCFPYRWFSAWLHDQHMVIVLLRFINVLFFAGGIVLLRRMLLKTRASAAAVHAVLLFLVLVPVVPLLAGQINYDNLLMLLVPLNLLLAWRFREDLRQKRPHSSVPLFLTAMSVGALASLAKFAYLPIFTAIAVYMAFIAVRQARASHKFWATLRKSWRSANRMLKYSAVVLAVISAGLFVEMYGVNIVKYHSIAPQCGQVLGIEPCLTYGPYARNYAYAQHHTWNGIGNPAFFVGNWLWGMFDRSFFVINGPGGPETYANKLPLPGISLAALAAIIFGAFLLVRYRRVTIARDPALAFLLFVSGVYIVALLGRNYYDYLQLGRMVAINGRYLVLVIAPVLLVLAMAYQEFLRKEWLAAVFVVAFVLFLQGGGALTFIHNSDANWYWPNSKFVLHMNQQVQRVTRWFIVGWPGGR